jgi:hypothetical protein
MSFRTATAAELRETFPWADESFIQNNASDGAVHIAKPPTMPVQPVKKQGAIKEKDWQKTVIDLAHSTGWKVAHFRGAWSKDGKRFMTPVAGDGAGFPDLVLARTNHQGKRQALFIELKTDKGILSLEQLEWLTILNGEVWKPSMLSAIIKILK